MMTSPPKRYLKFKNSAHCPLLIVRKKYGVVAHSSKELREGKLAPPLPKISLKCAKCFVFSVLLEVHSSETSICNPDGSSANHCT